MKQTRTKTIDERRQELLTGKVEPLVLKMAVPTIISMLVTSFYNLVDTYFIGQLDSNAATGAVGLVFAFMAIVQAFGFFFGHGSGNYMSRQLGAGNYQKAAEMAVTGFFLAVLVGLVLALGGFLLQEPLARLLGATDTMLADTLAYLRVILVSVPFFMAAYALNNQLRLQGNARFGMRGLLCGAILNMALDPLLIFGCDLGVSGAALATVISQAVSVCVLLVGTQRFGVRIAWRNFTPSGTYLAEIFNGGVPSLGRQLLASVALLLLNNFAGAYGDEAIAAFTVAGRITWMISSAVVGFGHGFQPVCGFNFGAGQTARVRRALRFSIGVSTGFLLVMAVLLFVFAPELIALFRNDEAVVRIGTDILRYQSLALPLTGYVVMVNMFLQNTRKVLPATVLAASRQGIMFIPALVVLNAVLGLLGLQLSQAVADVLTFILALCIGIPAIRRLKE